MNNRTGARPERRRHARICPKGTSLLRVDSYALHGRIANLGEGGMLVITEVDAPERLLGRLADVEVRLDGGFAPWLQATGGSSGSQAGGARSHSTRCPASSSRTNVLAIAQYSASPTKTDR